MSESRYIHGTHAEEQRRLSLLNELINRRSVDALRLRGGERVLDVGSGLGQMSREIARAVGPTGTVVGIERSPEQLATARSATEGDTVTVEFREGDATALPLAPNEWGSFDVVHTRFLLEHVPDPLSVVKQMVRAARPGGRIVLEDDDHDLLRMWPPCPPTERLWDVYQKSYAHLGNDPIVGRRLVEILHAAGAEPQRNDWLFFGSCAGEAHFEAYVANLAGVMDGAREVLIQAGLSDADAIDGGLDALRAWAQRDDAALWYCTSWAEGVV